MGIIASIYVYIYLILITKYCTPKRSITCICSLSAKFIFQVRVSAWK